MRVRFLLEPLYLNNIDQWDPTQRGGDLALVIEDQTIKSRRWNCGFSPKPCKVIQAF